MMTTTAARPKATCICGFKTVDSRRMSKHRITCDKWLQDGVRQWQAISGKQVEKEAS